MFLDLFVARRIPVDPKLRSFAPFVFDSIFHSKLDLPPTRLTDAASYEAALATWKAEPKVRLLLESGAGQPNDPGAPRAAFEQGFAQWPLPTTPLRLYFQPGGKLAAAAPTVATSASAFRHDPAAGARGVLGPGEGIWAKQPAYDWKQPAAGDAVVFEGEPLLADLPLVGPASVDLFLRSTVDDADVQVTLSELSPDGKETYVQSGWLRAGHRKPGPEATEYWPAQTMQQADFAPLPPGEWTSVRIPTAGFAHVLRAGSKVRVTVDTPGGTRAEWRFALKPFGADVRYGVAHEAAHPSSVVLPVVPTLLAPTPRPACGALRGQPCRDAVPFTNAPL
jgi:predicted acyl esterase